MPDTTSYNYLLNSRTHMQWQRIGLQRRAGIAVPLFSIYSKKSIGVGEIPDLLSLARWCASVGISIIQLLPMQDTGFDFCPYDAQSSFALDPMFLRLDDLAGVREGWQAEVNVLREQFPVGANRVNYAVKGEKLRVLWNVFIQYADKDAAGFKAFQRNQAFWLRMYCIFKVNQEVHLEKEWEKWPEDFRDAKAEAIQETESKFAESVLFHAWMQWQLAEQVICVKREARKLGVFLMGDMPFLVSRHSADVWQFPQYFKLRSSSGAPPDNSLACGQRWGMPPYDWNEIKKHDFDYMIQKLKYADLFYDMFRIDHAIGVFRLWTIPNSEPQETAGANGHYEPENESEWEAHGELILDAMIHNSQLLPCAEDLGSIPACSWSVFERYGIPGMDIQRWMGGRQFRKTSIASVSTHDMTPFNAWWETQEEDQKKKLLESWRSQIIPVAHASEAPIGLALQSNLHTDSIFSIQLLQDWMAFACASQSDEWCNTINVPGSFSKENWSWVCPVAVEEFGDLPANAELLRLIQQSGRSM